MMLESTLSVASLFLVLSPAAAPGPLTAGDHRIAVSHGGLARAYIVHVPPHATGPLPVVIALHGGGGNGAQQQRYCGLDRVADREGFLAVYPDGTGRLSRMLVWNAGTCCGRAPLEGIDDVGFIRSVVEDLGRRTPVDRARVYATGHSNGGMMSYRLAAEAPDLVAAIVPVAGSMVLARFKPTLPVPVMHIHSVDDPRALYTGGLGPPFPFTSTRVLHPPVEEQLAKWITHDGCPDKPTVEKTLVGQRGSQDEGNTATKLVYGPCGTGATVVLWKLTGSGHVWPGADRTFSGVLGRTTHLLDANEEAWAFFKNTRRN
jgi:polyhydroxybutyrate depolymerase